MLHARSPVRFSVDPTSPATSGLGQAFETEENLWWNTTGLLLDEYKLTKRQRRGEGLSATPVRRPQELIYKVSSEQGGSNGFWGGNLYIWVDITVDRDPSNSKHASFEVIYNVQIKDRWWALSGACSVQSHYHMFKIKDDAYKWKA